MISPSSVISAVIDRLKDQAHVIGVKSVSIDEIYDDFSKNLTPPYITVHADFTDEAEDTASAGHLVQIPVEVKLLVFTVGHKTPQQAFEQAFDIAVNALREARGSYVVEGENVFIIPRHKPFEIWAKKKDAAIIMCNLFYYDTIL